MTSYRYMGRVYRKKHYRIMRQVMGPELKAKREAFLKARRQARGHVDA